jgi:CheY-like chemotaxis protein
LLDLELHVVESKGDQEEGNCTCRPKILVVDDNDFNAMTLIQVLKGINTDFKTEEAQNGKIGVTKFKEALSQICNCKNRAFKLVLMDI